jgi:hypothetical protein
VPDVSELLALAEKIRPTLERNAENTVNLEIYGKALLGVEPNITPLI